jgi:hypothetical protein
MDKSLERLAPLLAAAGNGARASSASRNGKRKLNISPRRAAVLKLQGSYMGYMRQLPKQQKARVKSLKERKGFTAAIKLAKRLAAA